MKYHVSIAGKEFVVELDGSTAGARAVVSSESGPLVVELRRHSQSSSLQPRAFYPLIAQSRPQPGSNSNLHQSAIALLPEPGAPRGASLRLLVDNRLVAAHVESARDRLRARSRPQAAAAGPTTLASALPGVIRRILRRPGEVVESGAAILTLEAMKMENEVQAEAAGRIDAILVREGQVVNAGDPLVEMHLS